MKNINVDDLFKGNDKLKSLIKPDQINKLRAKCYDIVDTEGEEGVIDYLNNIYSKIDLFEEKQFEYIIESHIADKVYKSYITDGISRLDKINGRFMASQNMKLETIIEQNNRIIELLEEIAKK